MARRAAAIVGGAGAILVTAVTTSSVAAQTPTPAGGATAPCTLTATADKDLVAVGEAFAVTLHGTAPAGSTWTFRKEAGGDSVDLRAAPGQEASVVAAGTFRYDAAAFAVGSVEVPAIEAGCRTADGSEYDARSAPITLRMLSTLPKDPKEQRLADVRGPLSLSIGRAFWIALVAVALLGIGLAAALLAWLLRRRAPSGGTEQPLLTPDAEARTALVVLRREGWAARGYRAFYIALAQIAKRYLERRLGAPILEMTSSEAVAFLREDHRASNCAHLVRDLTAVADQIKFAQGSGQDEEAERHLRATEGMIDALEAALRPAGDAAKGEAA